MSPSATLAPLSGATTSTIARWQQCIGMGLWASTLVLVGWSFDARAPWAGWLALWLMALHPLVLALQMGLSIAVSRHRGATFTAAPRWGPWRAWWAEWWVSLLRFGWWQPWLWRRWPDASTPTPGRQGVVLVHGYVCNRGLWQRWMAELSRRERPFVAVNLEPLWGSIDTYADTLEQAVQRLHTLTGVAPLVVAHSMGGLAVRAWLRATPHAQARVAHIVTIGTPHHGTWLGRWGHTENGMQMREHSPWLHALAQAEPPELGAHFTCWHSEGDNIVFPLGTAVLPGCHERHLPWVGHVAMVDHPSVISDTLALLRE